MFLLVALQYCLYVITFLIALWYILYFKYERYLKKIPGPRPLPLIGNALEFRDVSEFLSINKRLHDKYGDFVKVTIGFGAPKISITNVKALEFIMSSSKVIDKSNDYKGFLSWLGLGLLTSTGERWRKHRKLITPTFHFQILEQFIDVFDTYIDVMIEKLQKECGKESVNIYPFITLCSLDIICASAMGTTVNAQEDTESDYVKSVKEMCRILIERSVSPIKSCDLLYYFTNDYQVEKKALKVLHGYTNAVIASRKKVNLAEKEDNCYDDNDVYTKKRKTFIDLLLEHNNNDNENALTDEDIRQEVDTFMFEGHDTTSSGISFILYSLASHQKIQERVVEELKDIFNDDQSRNATYKDLNEMKYLELVIKESLRLYPSVPMFSRNISEDIQYNGEIIPKNVSITIFPYAIHRSPEYFPDPEKFDPERFSTENQAKRSPYVYIPFSAGPRNCIGQKFAMLEMKSVVSKIVRNFHLLPTNPEHKLHLVGETILKSRNGVHIRLRNRKL